MKIPFFFCLTLFLIPAVYSQSTDFENPQLSSVASNKPILMIFSGSDWCKPCILLKKEVLQSPAFQSYAKDHLVIQEVDFPYRKANKLSKEKQQANDALAAKYNPEGNFPKVILLNAGGEIIGKIKSRETSSCLQEIQMLLKGNS